uniref:Uncharacterized protein n=1 Tax=Cacopsylla melanoneura TaxID=428564 RepID=A0A8D9EYU2_9HEMI
MKLVILLGIMCAGLVAVEASEMSSGSNIQSLHQLSNIFHDIFLPAIISIVKISIRVITSLIDKYLPPPLTSYASSIGHDSLDKYLPPSLTSYVSSIGHDSSDKYLGKVFNFEGKTVSGTGNVVGFHNIGNEGFRNIETEGYPNIETNDDGNLISTVTRVKDSNF